MRAAEDDKLSRLRGVREQEGRGRREEPVSPVRVGKDGWKEGSKRGEALSRPLRRQRRRGVGKRECEEGGGRREERKSWENLSAKQRKALGEYERKGDTRIDGEKREENGAAVVRPLWRRGRSGDVNR